MADAVELAVAYLQIVPSMEGSQGKILEELIPQAERTGADAAEGLGKKFSGGLGKLAVPTAIAGFGAAAAKGLYEVGSTFDELSDTIRVGTGASGDALEGLVGVAQNVGRTVPAEFDRIGPVVADLNTRLGLSGDTLETVASQYLEAGRILGQDVDIAQTSAAFSAFAIEGANVEGAMDDLFRVSQATGVGMNELAAAVQRNAPTAKLLGLSFAETASMVGAFDKAGLESQQLMSAMGRGLVTLARDGEEPRDAFERVTGEIGAFLEQGNEAAALDLASQVFGTRGATQFIDAVKSGTLATEDMMGAIGATGDTILGVSDETADFSESWQLVKNNAALALEPLASGVFSSLASSLQGAMPYLQSFGSWLADNQWVLGVVATVVGVTLVAAFGAWAASVWASTAALLANPVTWIVIGVVALAAALIALVKNWDSVVAFLGNVWNAAVKGAAGIFTWLGEQLAAAGAWIDRNVRDAFLNMAASVGRGVDQAITWVTGLPGRAVAALSSLASYLGGAAQRGFSALYQRFTEGGARAVSFVAGLPGRAVAALSSLGSRLAGIARTAWAAFQNAVSTGIARAVSFVAGLPGRIKGALAGAGSWLVGIGSQVLQGFINGAKRMASRVASAVLAPIKGAVSGVKKFLGINSPSRLFREFGENTGEGLAIGMDRTGSDIERAADRMATAALPDLTPPAFTAGALAGARGVGPAAAGAGPLVNGPLVHVDEMNVRNDDDIRKISQRLQAGIESKLRAGGRLTLSPTGA